MRREPEYPQHPAGRPAHDEKQGAGQGQEDVHGRRHRQRHLLRALQRQRLGNQFAQDDVQAGDQDERDENCNAVSVNRGVRNVLDRTQHHLGQQRLTHPAQGQADDGDAQLDAVDHFVQVAVQLLHDAGANAPGAINCWMRVSRTLTRENSAAAKNALAATRSRMRNTRSST